MIVAVQIFLGIGLVGSVYAAEASSSVALPLKIGGVLLFIIAIVMLLKARRDLGRSFGIHPRPLDGAVFVRRGIYAKLRHPMYSAVVLICLGVAVTQPTRWVLAAAAINIVFYLIKARYEESLLRQRYPEYEQYQRESRGVIPFLS